MLSAIFEIILLHSLQLLTPPPCACPLPMAGSAPDSIWLHSGMISGGMLQISFDHLQYVSTRSLPAANYRCCQAPFACSTHYTQPRKRSAERQCTAPSAIRTVIVDHDELIGALRSFQNVAHRPNHRIDVLGLIEGGATPSRVWLWSSGSSNIGTRKGLVGARISFKSGSAYL